MKGLGALPQNELVWRKGLQLAQPGEKGATSSPPVMKAPPKPAKYPKLPVNMASEFPYQIKEPFLTRNLAWYTNGTTINAGYPQYVNDEREYLRSAMVDSDWPRVEKWLAWKFSKMTAKEQQSFYKTFNFGSYKWVADGRGGQKYLPFSKLDLRTFFGRFKRFASGKDATGKCLDDTLALLNQNYARDSANTTKLNVPQQLIISVCPVQISLAEGLTKIVALTAFVVAVPMLLSYAATGSFIAAPTSGAGAGAAGTAGAVGTAPGAVTVTAPTFVAPTVAPIGAGAASTGVAAAGGALPVLETVTVSAGATGAAAGGAAAGGGIATAGTGAVGAAISQAGGSAGSAASQTVAKSALDQAKKIALDLGTDKALEALAAAYAGKLTKDAEKKARKDIEDMLAQIAAEEAALGHSPTAQAVKAGGIGGNIGLLAGIGVAIVAALMLSKKRR